MSSRGLCHPCSLRDEKKRSGRGVGILGENLSGWSFRIRGLCSKISAPPGPAEKSPRAAVRILQGAAGAAGHARFAQENEGKGMAGPQMAFQSRGESCPSRLHGFSTKAALDLGMCSLLGAHPAASVGLSPLPHTHTALPSPFQGCDSRCCTAIHMSLQEETGKSWSRTKKQMQAGTTGRVHQETGEDVPSRNS